MSEDSREFEEALLAADLAAGNEEAAEMQRERLDAMEDDE